ncbi:MAG: epoxyqueuosine reductase [Desulfobacteraceae bacterium]|nr:epoxyqueuosine reductase [Desulfobacteraceae bacterium]
MAGSTVNADWIRMVIEAFIADSPENTLQNNDQEKAFAKPLVGFSRGDDPLYEAYKEHVGPFFVSPWELFALTFGAKGVRPENLTVISYILPQTEATKADNRKEKIYPSDRWARARIFGEEVNVKLRRHLVAALTEKGCRAVAPVLTPQFSRRISPQYGLSSTWSERHAAYAAGLGTFGLCDGLITSAGKAMRVGSVVAEVQIPPTPRPYHDHRAYCLYFSHGICKKCAARCPAGAITEAGKDKNKCLQHVRKTSAYVKERFGFDGYGCGLCQTGVPCESKIPIKREG